MISFASGQLPVPSVQIKAMFSRVFFSLAQWKTMQI